MLVGTGFVDFVELLRVETTRAHELRNDLISAALNIESIDVIAARVQLRDQRLPRRY